MLDPPTISGESFVVDDEDGVPCEIRTEGVPVNEETIRALWGDLANIEHTCMREGRYRDVTPVKITGTDGKTRCVCPACVWHPQAVPNEDDVFVIGVSCDVDENSWRRTHCQRGDSALHHARVMRWIMGSDVITARINPDLVCATCDKIFRTRDNKARHEAAEEHRDTVVQQERDAAETQAEILARTALLSAARFQAAVATAYEGSETRAFGQAEDAGEAAFGVNTYAEVDSGREAALASTSQPQSAFELRPPSESPSDDSGYDSITRSITGGALKRKRDDEEEEASEASEGDGSQENAFKRPKRGEAPEASLGTLKTLLDWIYSTTGSNLLSPSDSASSSADDYDATTQLPGSSSESYDSPSPAQLPVDSEPEYNEWVVWEADASL
ncbi:hypothetical protein EUX98_g6404 [Antrodiella citrinella]|uniref:C2H2-type domain-containing protein n=1 Tax=Antrodiella citrinella TaxID=2447956 RepID=A0A4S4MRQ0_9APHY|nr:hypothetical protein EUX98_g6404 [Antrodiella citrinella]